MLKMNLMLFDEEKDRHKYYNDNMYGGTPNPKIRHSKGRFVVYGDTNLKFIIDSLLNLKSLVTNPHTYNDYEMIKNSSRVSNKWLMEYFKFILRVPTFQVGNIHIRKPIEFLAEFLQATSFSGIIYLNTWERTIILVLNLNFQMMWIKVTL